MAMMLVSGIRPYLEGNPMNYQTIGSTEYEASRIAMGVMRMAGKRAMRPATSSRRHSTAG